MNKKKKKRIMADIKRFKKQFCKARDVFNRIVWDVTGEWVEYEKVRKKVWRKMSVVFWGMCKAKADIEEMEDVIRKALDLKDDEGDKNGKNR